MGGGLIGMMIYAGVFYSNVRRDVRTSQEIDGSVYQSFEEAEKLANEWVAVGGTYTVKTSTRVRRSVPLSVAEKKALAVEKDQELRKKIELEYGQCLDQAQTNLDRELCSFGTQKFIVDKEAKVPQAKIVEEKKVVAVEYPRRECSHDQELQSFECLEIDVAPGEVVNQLDQVDRPVKLFQQFRY